MTPSTETQMKTNRDSAAHVTYRVRRAGLPCVQLLLFHTTTRVLCIFYAIAMLWLPVYSNSVTSMLQVEHAGEEGAVVSVNEAGQVVSGSRLGEALLVVTAHEDFGVNQTLVILVKVNSKLQILSHSCTHLWPIQGRLLMERTVAGEDGVLHNGQGNDPTAHSQQPACPACGQQHAVPNQPA